MTPHLPWLLAAGLSTPPLTHRLAPTLSEVEAAQQELERLLYRARSIDAALGRVHNTLAEDHTGGCDDPDAQQLAARARLLGGSLRDALQSSRQQLAETDEMMQQRSVSAVLRVEHRDTMGAAREELSDLLLRWSAAAAWQDEAVEPWFARCPVTVAPGPGLPAPLAPVSSDVSTGTAVILGSGYLCPLGEPAETLAILTAPMACLAETDACDCAPKRVHAAAVLSAEVGR